MDLTAVFILFSIFIREFIILSVNLNTSTYVTYYMIISYV